MGYGFRGARGKVIAAVVVALAVGGIYLLVERGKPVSSVLPSFATGSPHSLMQTANPVTEAPAGTAKKPGSPDDVSSRPTKKYVMIETDPKNADILLGNGELLDKTPARIDLSEIDSKGIVLSKEGYERKRIPESALAGRDTFRVELEPAMGVVDVIQAIPWARVYLGKRFLGDTPLTDVRLPVGEHRLRFVNEPLGVDKAEKLSVRPGRNPKLIVQMTGESWQRSD